MCAWRDVVVTALCIGLVVEALLFFSSGSMMVSSEELLEKVYEVVAIRGTGLA